MLKMQSHLRGHSAGGGGPHYKSAHLQTLGTHYKSAHLQTLGTHYACDLGMILICQGKRSRIFQKISSFSVFNLFWIVSARARGLRVWGVRYLLREPEAFGVGSGAVGRLG